MEKLTESLEKYLLAIYELSKSRENITVKDVSGYLKIGGASTSEAIKTLRNKGYVSYVPYGTISITLKGQEAIETKLYRHNTIADFLNKVLNIEKNSADENASAIEYSMTQDVLVKFVHFLDFMQQCSCKEPKWIKSCKHNLETGKMPDKCEACKTTRNCCGSCCGTDK
ncbi:metal-dependent transcriptional regulator [bacterium]|nr:metal-dependent transcriptional regulator [bacterium]